MEQSHGLDDDDASTRVIALAESCRTITGGVARSTTRPARSISSTSSRHPESKLRTTYSAALVALAAASTPVLADCGFEDPAVSAWVINRDGRMGQSGEAAIHAVVSLVLADVERVRFTPTDAYVEASGVPTYIVGPFPDGNPAVPSDQNWVLRIPRQPVDAAPGSETATGLGQIGVWINGVVVYNAKDARSYQNRDIWHQNAVVVEADGFDAALGHPSPGRVDRLMGTYHHHQRPVSLLAQIGDDGVSHSAVVGFGFDGYPIHGPYGFANPDGSGGVVRIRSSYQLRSITLRDTLPDGTALALADHGPAVSATYPLGYYIEDFEYVAGLGDLDEHNGRFAVTPAYPAGIYTYYTTSDAAGESAFPYAIGPTYKGVVATDNFRPPVTVPAAACTYSIDCREGDCPGGCEDGMDDDLDGLADCLDADCAGDPACLGADADFDGVADALDCAPLDASAWSVPVESAGLRVTRALGGGDAILDWADDGPGFGGGTTYEVASEPVSVVISARQVSAPCIVRGLGTASHADSTAVTDDVLCYLVRAVNSCGPLAGEGWGTSSLGVARAACP
jgi:hypothetical protein